MTKVRAPKQQTIKYEGSGNEYVMQIPSNMVALEIMDATEGTAGKFKMGPSFPLMVKHMIIEPQNLDVESIEDIKELIWLGSNCFRFLNDPNSVPRTDN